MLCAIIIFIICLNIVLVFACALCSFFFLLNVLSSENKDYYYYYYFVNCSVKRPKFAPKWSISFFQPILATIFASIATVKFKLISDLYTWAIVLIN